MPLNNRRGKELMTEVQNIIFANIKQTIDEVTKCELVRTRLAFRELHKREWSEEHNFIESSVHCNLH